MSKVGKNSESQELGKFDKSRKRRGMHAMCKVYSLPRGIFVRVSTMSHGSQRSVKHKATSRLNVLPVEANAFTEIDKFVKTCRER